MLNVILHYQKISIIKLYYRKAIRSICHSLDYQRGFASCENGTLISFGLQLIQQTTPSGQKKTTDQTKKMNVRKLEDHHVGSPLTGEFIKLESDITIIVTAGEDGYVNAWSSTQYEILEYKKIIYYSKLQLCNTKLCSIAAAPNRPVFSVGNVNGEVWIVCARSEDSGRPEDKGRIELRTSIIINILISLA